MPIFFVTCHFLVLKFGLLNFCLFSRKHHNFHQLAVWASYSPPSRVAPIFKKPPQFLPIFKKSHQRLPIASNQHNFHKKYIGRSWPIFKKNPSFSPLYARNPLIFCQFSRNTTKFCPLQETNTIFAKNITGDPGLLTSITGRAHFQENLKLYFSRSLLNFRLFKKRIHQKREPPKVWKLWSNYVNFFPIFNLNKPPRFSSIFTKPP